MHIKWRSQIDIDEENRYGSELNLSRVVAVTTLACSKCGGEINEIRFKDGRRSFDVYGITTTILPDGGSTVAHHRCPDPVREDDLRHDADLERFGETLGDA